MSDPIGREVHNTMSAEFDSFYNELANLKDYKPANISKLLNNHLTQLTNKVEKLELYDSYKKMVINFLGDMFAGTAKEFAQAWTTAKQNGINFPIQHITAVLQQYKNTELDKFYKLQASKFIEKLELPSPMINTTISSFRGPINSKKMMSKSIMNLLTQLFPQGSIESKKTEDGKDELLIKIDNEKHELSITFCNAQFAERVPDLLELSEKTQQGKSIFGSSLTKINKNEVTLPEGAIRTLASFPAEKIVEVNKKLSVQLNKVYNSDTQKSGKQ